MDDALRYPRDDDDGRALLLQLQLCKAQPEQLMLAPYPEAVVEAKAMSLDCFLQRHIQMHPTVDASRKDETKCVSSCIRYEMIVVARFSAVH